MRMTTKLFHVRGNIQGDVNCVHACIRVSARSNGCGGDARPLEALAPSFGDGTEAIGPLVVWIHTGEPPARAEKDMSRAWPYRRCRDLVANCRHNTRKRMQSGVTTLILSPDNRLN